MARARHPFLALTALFCGWKALLLMIAAGSCVGPTYDTSSGLLAAAAEASSGLPQPALITRLASWDAVYFVQIASRGYLFEQEWAFLGGLPTVVSLIRQGLVLLGWPPSSLSVTVLAIIVAHLSHLLSAFVLYRLGKLVWRDDRVALIAAYLHVLSPAGLFLSAPYAESSFSLLAFIGYYLFARGCLEDDTSVYGGILQLAAGVFFGLATAFRSNGILNGVLFAFEAVRALAHLVRRPQFPTLTRLLFLGGGGVCVAAGSAIPQFLAYLRYCSGPSEVGPRPWCTHLVPSIYTFVQGHYWNSGLFRYWTLSNLPLFVLATPMLLILGKSGLDILSAIRTSLRTGVQNPYAGGAQLVSMVGCMAAAQTLLVLFALTSHHVQIITRLSSGYPIWYWWLARALVDGQKSGVAGGIVVFMIMYASIQGVLFASFLPPA